jgi:hypothetical protein
MSLSTKAYKVTIRHPMWPGRSETFHFDDLDASQRFMKFWIAIKGDADFEHVLHLGLAPPEPWPGPPSATDGGPAFPAHIAEIQGIATHSGEFAMPGMSLRDYFAGQVIAGYAARSIGKIDEKWPGLSDLARWAYQQADELLKAREQS